MSEVHRAGFLCRNCGYFLEGGDKHTCFLSPPTVVKIVRRFLVEKGYDGLFSPGECACKLIDLEPCGQMTSECEAGYLHPGDADSDWYIRPQKP